MKVGVVFDESFLGHQPGRGHPERPERLEALRALVEGPDALGGLEVGASRPAAEADLLRVHTRDHVDLVRESAHHASYQFDPDTTASAGSYEAALRSAGAGLLVLDQIHDGQIDTGFALVRPPGHHAEHTRAMGFCLLNNIAILARYAQAVHGFERVLVIDWDVHHGNGTQHSFETDPSVLFLSTHRYPFYPGTGALTEIGRHAGRYATINVPLPAGAGDDDYAAIFERIVRPAMLAYRPSCVLVSAGFDAHERDPLGGMRVTSGGFGAMAAAVAGAVGDLDGVPLVLLLEGGYDLDGLRDSVGSVLGALRDDAPVAAAPTETRTAPIVEAVVDLHEGFEPLSQAAG